jgi:ABC-type uncharacterized transport system fused permease/ATPase subunit
VVPRDAAFLPRRAVVLSNGESIREQVLYPFDMHPPPPDADIVQVLDQVGLLGRFGKDLDARTPADLSGGEEQRLACCRVLLRRPAWVFMDEGTSACSVDFEREFFARLVQLGVTFCAVTHRPESVMHLASHVVTIHGPDSSPVVRQQRAESGRVVATPFGSAQLLFRRPDDGINVCTLTGFGATAYLSGEAVVASGGGRGE